jgi:hypothetical protein
MLRKSSFVLTLVGMLTAMGSVLAAPAGNDVTLPTGIRQWFQVNSMIVTKDSPLFDQIGGLHNVYINAVGLATLKKGGALPYPDGTVFADDIHEFSVKDGSYVEGNQKAVTAMVKDAKKYAATGGWGFQLWIGGDPQKPIVTDAAKQCFACHSAQKENDFVFSTYIP